MPIDPRRRLLDEQDPTDPLGPDAPLPGEADAVGTDQLSDEDLAALAGEGADTIDLDQLSADDLQSQLNGADPAARADIQARLALAARRRLAGGGMGGGF